MKILFFGGLGEIGMNCLALETETQIIIIDCGVMFSDLDHFGIEYVIPDFSYLLERKDKLKGFVLTHGHEDHIGSLAYAFKAGLQAPVYASPFTTLLVKERMKEHGLESRVQIQTFTPGQTVAVGEFSIKTVSVNHSIVDACALIIDTPVGKVIHTGDFKIDATPFYGTRIDENEFRRAGDAGVLLLLSDSTNVERCDPTLSERNVYQKFEQLFAQAEGMIVIAMFASNVGRMGQIMEIAKKTGKKVALSGRTMETNARLSQTLDYLKDAPEVLIGMDEVPNYGRNDVIVVSSGSQAEPGSSLMRASTGDHRHIQFEKGDLVLMSSRYIPGNERAIGRMINQLFEQGAEVLYEAVHDIHTSGHATKPELKQMLEWTKPKFFIPVHGEYRHLVHHAKLAVESGVPSENAVVVKDGAILNLTKDRLAVVGNLEQTRVWIEGGLGGDVSKALLKERRQLGEKGVVFALLVRDPEYRKIVAGPDIIAKGLTSESVEAWIIEEARDRTRAVVENWERMREEGSPEHDLQETIRIELRRFFNANLGKKPTVIPVIIDLD